MPNTTNLVFTGIRISARLDNKHKQKYGLFAKLSLSVIEACDVANNPHIFITGANQHIQEINLHFVGILNRFDPLVFSETQEQN